MKVLACETCNTFALADDGVGIHAGHKGLVIEGDDADELTRVAVTHLEIAAKIRNGYYDRLLDDA